MMERPILFSGPMVRALLDGRKTQTRRVVKWRGGLDMLGLPCPYGEPGDRLWVRETWAPRDSEAFLRHEVEADKLFYRADDERHLLTDGRWRPSIHMPRWASRITLEVASVRVERVQDITDADALAEGVTNYGDDSQFPPGFSMSTRAARKWRPRREFRDLWDSINGKRPGCAWSDNPWVWAVTFKVIRLEVP